MTVQLPRHKDGSVIDPIESARRLWSWWCKNQSAETNDAVAIAISYEFLAERGDIRVDSKLTGLKQTKTKRKAVRKAVGALLDCDDTTPSQRYKLAAVMESLPEE